MRAPTIASDAACAGSPTAADDRVLVVVCGDLATSAALGWRVAAESLDPSGDRLPVAMVPDVCADPAGALAFLQRTGSTGLVLVVCGRAVELAEARSALARGRIDPFRIEALQAGDLARAETGGPDSLAVLALLAAAVARVRAAPLDSRHARKAKPLVRLGRRSLFELRMTTPQAVATVDATQCQGGRCLLCLQACPTGAIRVGPGGRPEVAPDRCDGCGVCQAACPLGAISVPGASLAEYERSLEALLGALGTTSSATSFGVLFHCPEVGAPLRGALAATTSERAGRWIPFELPCVALVTPGWLLQVLAAGACDVGLVPCEPLAASLGGSRLREHVDFCRLLLGELGDPDAERRVWFPGGHDPTRPPPPDGLPPVATVVRFTPPVVHLEEPGATAKAALGLARTGRPGGRVDHAGSPLGCLSIQAAACTACGACARICPTSALDFEPGPEVAVLRWDPGRCLPCGYCEAVCPEHALAVTTAVDVAQLGRGQVTLFEETVAPCQLCGRPAIGRAMAERVRAMLPDGSGAFLDTSAECCVDCLAGGPGRLTALFVPPAAVRPSPKSGRRGLQPIGQCDDQDATA